VLAYLCVQLIWMRLKASRIHSSWASLHRIVSVQRWVTASFDQKEGRRLNIRKTTQPEPALKEIYATLGVDPLPGGTNKLAV